VPQVDLKQGVPRERSGEQDQHADAHGPDDGPRGHHHGLPVLDEVLGVILAIFIRQRRLFNARALLRPTFGQVAQRSALDVALDVSLTTPRDVTF
jgi:hypothetical protein